MKKLPIGKQVFRRVIEDGCVYVDKTEILLKMIETSVPIFLSRPRRFGKSLTVFTLLELFKGSRDLFEGTYASTHWDWTKQYSVIRLDLSLCSGKSVEEINEKLLNAVSISARENKVTLEHTSFPDIAFGNLIQQMSLTSKVVVLLDEYDSPILDNLQNEILPSIKESLRNFFKVLKGSEPYLHRVFITGITKFSKMGIFSALNNLFDISHHEEYATMAGYTQEEIALYFREYIELAKAKHGFSEEQFWHQLKHYYNGYSWDGVHFLFNPFSVLNFFSQFQFYPYWMESGSPSYIVKYAQSQDLSLEKLKGAVVAPNFMSENDIEEATALSFLTQAGYLTIRSIDECGDYVLDIPNYEVEHTFNVLLLKSRYAVDEQDLMGVKRAIRKACIENNTIALIEQLKIVYSSIPYMHFDNNKNEHFYHSVLLMFLRACGYDLVSEDVGNQGRSDLTLFWEERVYIFELKCDGSAQSALEQIIAKNYAGKYANRSVIAIGLRIDYSCRNIVEWASA